ncbi:MAG: hypothetical protein Q4G49_13915 [Paracoccus sp. (in: a-proteobacteria)]|nr:hypothetical protein [Paracoccus sp. (in: a-proteobacteria)]
MTMRLMLATTAGLIWAGAAFAQSGCGGPVSFADGQSGALVGGRIVGTSTCDYTLRAKAGQRLAAQVTSQGAVTARVIAPVQQDLSAQPWALPQSGDYTVRLSQNSDAAASGQAQQFTVEFRLTGSAAAAARPAARPSVAPVAQSAAPSERPAAPDTAAATPPETRPTANLSATRPLARPARSTAAPAETAPASAAATPTAPASTPAPSASPATATPAATAGNETRCNAAETLDRDATGISGRIAAGGTCDYTVTSVQGQTLTLVMPRSDGFRVEITAPNAATLTPDQPLTLAQPGPQTIRVTRTGGEAADFVARLRLDTK